MPAPSRIEATAEALLWIAILKAKHGPLMFYLSSGCCEGSSPMCFVEGDYRVNEADILLGEVGCSPFYLSAQQFEYWRHTQLILDVTPGQGSGFSLEAPEGVSFLTRSRVFSDGEVAALSAAGIPPRAS
ncbi:DUF779 domain-containing protein [Rhodoblastus sp.]|jgi:hypothetical protein|uniref:DUF779 domain-containing protein n=1 Tax=Rhodoblastus sp. TaxID=1962975 RepID=UPI0025CCF654|nr:DUF779 domain-containing protein [Rhodoblastus sp.]